MNNNPIGIFDSGVGGTSVWREIIKILPFENTIYLADSKNAPYGTRSKNEIIRLSKKNTDYLLEKKCKIIVVACNTATTNAIDYLRKHYNLAFIGIEPAIKPAALKTKSKKIGILATKGTLTSELFAQTSEIFAKEVQVFEQIGTGLVEIVEKNEMKNDLSRELLKKYLDPMIEKKIDHLILGCTHYPYLIPQIKDILPKDVIILDSGEAVAKQTYNVLKKMNLLSNRKTKPLHKIYTNADENVLKLLLKDVQVDKIIERKDF